MAWDFSFLMLGVRRSETIAVGEFGTFLSMWSCRTHGQLEIVLCVRVCEVLFSFKVNRFRWSCSIKSYSVQKLGVKLSFGSRAQDVLCATGVEEMRHWCGGDASWPSRSPLGKHCHHTLFSFIKNIFALGVLLTKNVCTVLRG